MHASSIGLYAINCLAAFPSMASALGTWHFSKQRTHQHIGWKGVLALQYAEVDLQQLQIRQRHEPPEVQAAIEADYLEQASSKTALRPLHLDANTQEAVSTSLDVYRFNKRRYCPPLRTSVKPPPSKLLWCEFTGKHSTLSLACKDRQLIYYFAPGAVEFDHFGFMYTHFKWTNAYLWLAHYRKKEEKKEAVQPAVSQLPPPPLPPEPEMLFSELPSSAAIAQLSIQDGDWDLSESLNGHQARIGRGGRLIFDRSGQV